MVCLDSVSLRREENRHKFNIHVCLDIHVHVHVCKVQGILKKKLMLLKGEPKVSTSASRDFHFIPHFFHIVFMYIIGGVIKPCISKVL